MKHFLLLIAILLLASCSLQEDSQDLLEEQKLLQSEMLDKKGLIGPAVQCATIFNSPALNTYLPNGSVAGIHYEPTLNGSEGFAILRVRTYPGLTCNTIEYANTSNELTFTIPTLYENSAFVIFSLTMLQEKIFEYRFEVYSVSADGSSCYTETDWACYATYNF
ncbi:MAG: hypothetical protein GYB32_14650 [Algicola sp.]|nr:hypothetical protein [Algicola sp.]